MWALHHLEQRLRRRQSGELRHARVRHADDTPQEGFAWRTTPTATGVERTSGPGEPGRSAREQRQGAAIARQLAQGLHQSTTLFAQQEPRRAPSGQNSPSTPALAARAVQNSPRTPALAARAVQNSPSTPALAACPVQNSPSTPTLTACPVQNSPRSPKMAQFGAVSACRESFVPF